PGAARRLLEVLSYPDSLRAAVIALTSRVVVVDDLDRAAEVLATRPELRVVTREGDLAGSGWLVGGSDRAPSRLEIQAEIDTAETELRAAQRHA
ncbi:hypothetical protein, partial [Saezia sanguinis]